MRGPRRKKGFEVLCDTWGLWLRREAWVEVLGVYAISTDRGKGEDRCPERAEIRVRGNPQNSRGPPTPGASPPPPSPTISALRPPTQDHGPSMLGPRCPVPLALTFKVPLLLPPTFTLILLPKENLQEQRTERDVRGHTRARSCSNPPPP